MNACGFRGLSLPQIASYFSTLTLTLIVHKGHVEVTDAAEMVQELRKAHGLFTSERPGVEPETRDGVIGTRTATSGVELAVAQNTVELGTRYSLSDDNGDSGMAGVNGTGGAAGMNGVGAGMKPDGGISTQSAALADMGIAEMQNYLNFVAGSNPNGVVSPQKAWLSPCASPHLNFIPAEVQWYHLRSSHTESESVSENRGRGSLLVPNLL